MLGASNVDSVDKTKMTEFLLKELEHPTIPYGATKSKSSLAAMTAVSDAIGEIDDDDNQMYTFDSSSGPTSAEPSTFMSQYTAYITFAFGYKGLSSGFDVLQFWREHESRFPLLAMMAKCRLSAPASSAPSERTFSIAKQIITDRRNRLAPTTASMCMIVRANRDLVFKKAAFAPPGSVAARMFRIGM